MDGNPIRYSDLIKADNSITDLIKQLDELSDSYMNVAENIKNNAIKVVASLNGVSGATETGRKKIKEAATETDKLTKAIKERNFAESRTNEQLAELKLATKEANDIAKLKAKIMNSEEGSYNRLSAQYSLNKIILNSMSAEERQATKDGQELERETASLYEQMKLLQEATGKHQLNVGNYAEATVGLRSQIMQLTEELVKLRLEGKQNTSEYQELSKKAGDLKDAFMDAQQEIKNMASDTGTLDSVLGGLAAGSGGFAAATGAMQLFGGESENVAEAQKKLQSVIAITNGLQALQNNLQKQSALYLGVKKIQLAAATKAQALNNTTTWAGVAAQKAFNLVANANPYVLLATALITVVGALIAFTAGNHEGAKSQKEINDLTANWLDYLERESTELKRVSNEKVESYKRELELAKEKNASLEETRQIEDVINSEKIKAHSQSVGFYQSEIEGLESNRAKIKELQEALYELNNLKAKGENKIRFDVDLDGKIEKVKVDEAIDAVQGQIDNLGKQVEIAVSLKTEGAELENELAILAEKRRKEEEANQKAETDILRKAEDARIALIADGYKRKEAQIKANAARNIADIQFQLDTEKNLTERARAALNEKIISLQRNLQNELLQNMQQQAAAERSAMRETEDLRIELMADGAEKQRTQLNIQYARLIEDLTVRLETEKGLTLAQVEELEKQRALIIEQYRKKTNELEANLTLENLNKEAETLQLKLAYIEEGSEAEMELKVALLNKQREIELAENNKLAEDKRQNEFDINAKYDNQILIERANFYNDLAMLQFDQIQALEASEFDLLKTTEQKKTIFKLQQEKARLQQILKLNETAAKKMSDVEIATIQNTISKINQEIEKTETRGGGDIYSAMGLVLDDGQKDAINTSLNYAMQAVNDFMQARVDAANAAVEAADAEVDAAQKTLDAQIDAKNKGYAADVDGARKELELAKKTQSEAVKNQKQAQKQQQAIETLQQASSLITASAMIWGQLGFPWAIPALAVMWASFAASKIIARKATEQYGEGTVELLEGGSHASGNDIDLGTKKDGTRRRAEGGEFFAVINKRNSKRYRHIIPDLVKSLNNGTFAEKYLNAFNDGDYSLNINEKTDISELTETVKEIKAQNEKRVYREGNKTVIYYKNTKLIVND